MNMVSANWILNQGNKHKVNFKRVSVEKYGMRKSIVSQEEKKAEIKILIVEDTTY